MLDDSGIYAFKDRGSDLNSSDAPEAGETGTPQSPLNSIDSGSLPLSGTAEPDDVAAPATDADTSITVASNTSVPANAERAGPLGNFSSADEANEIFGSGTNAGFLMLGDGAASQNPLSFFGNDETFGSTSTEHSELAALPGRGGACDIFGVAKEANRGSSEQPVANEIDTPSVVSTTDVVAQAPTTASPITVAAGAAVTIEGASAQSVTFAGSTGTLILNDAACFHWPSFWTSRIRRDRSCRCELRT